MKTLFTLILILFIPGFFSCFILTENEQAIITQFGKPTGKALTEAGLHFHIPFIQKIRRLEKRVLNWDGSPKMINTKDQKYIMVDTTARWKIVDPLKFIQTLQNEKIARTRIDDILDGETRKIISSNRLVEVVRNTNNIINEKTERLEEESAIARIEKIENGRDKLSELIFQSSSHILSNMGIQLIDIQIKRVSYEESVEKKVYERMISERKRIVGKIRSIGLGEKAKIEGKISEELQQIKSEAYKKSQEIRGKANAEAIFIYGKALSKNPSFYSFIRKLEAYEKSINKNTSLIFSASSDFFKQLSAGTRQVRRKRN